jgi:steroid delta-isomerase-like uncharacterized protein
MSEQNKALERRFAEEVWNQGNLAVLDELLAPQFVEYTAPPGLPPGPAGLKAFVQMYRAAFPDAHLTIEDLLADGDKVVSRWTGTGTHLGPLFGIPATGKKMSVEGIGIHRYSEGKIIESWNVFDQLSMLQQLGVIPPPGQGAS